jgi:Ras-related protein Rab-5C
VLTVIIGNKLDADEERKVSAEKGEHKAKELGGIWLEVSAKQGRHINRIFRKIGEHLPELGILKANLKSENSVVLSDVQVP